MFGASKPAGGGLFGQSSGNNQPSTGLFGAKPPAPSGGGLFGNSNNIGPRQFGQPAQPSQQPAGNAFSLGGSQQQQQPQQSGFGGTSLFGSNNKPTLGGNTTSNSLLGSQAPNNSSSLFGSQNQQQPTLNVTGQSQPAGQSSFQQPLGQQQQQQQQQQPMITPFTRPSDLPEAFQKELENTDNYIRQQEQLSKDLSHVIPDHQALVTSIPRDVQLLRFKLTSAKETLIFDDGQLAKLKRLVDTDFADAELLAEVTNQPRKYDRLMPYFRKVIEREPQIDQLALAMRDVQQAVTAEEFGKRVTYDDQGLRALPDALKEEYLYFMSLSDRVAELHRHIKDREEGETDEMQM